MDSERYSIGIGLRMWLSGIMTRIFLPEGFDFLKVDGTALIKFFCSLALVCPLVPPLLMLFLLFL